VNEIVAGLLKPAEPGNPIAWGEQFNEAPEPEKVEPALVSLYKQSHYARLVAWTSSKLNPRPPAVGDAVSKRGKKSKSFAERRASVPEVVGLYLKRVAQVQAIAKVHGFSVHFFWQPHLMSISRELKDYEQSILKRHFVTGGFAILLPQMKGDKMMQLIREAEAIAKARLRNRDAEGIHYLGGILDGETERTLFDWCHMGLRGNRLVASHIARAIKSGTAP